jgi:hypothetical protein
MGLHANYYPIPQTTLADFITNWHSEGFWKVISLFREESRKSGQEFYIGTTWHVLDFIINTPDICIPELIYAVRGHEFPAPDGSICLKQHLPSYNDEYWQGYTYVTAAEVKAIAQYLPLIEKSEFDARYTQDKMKEVYHYPIRANEAKEEYLNLLVSFQDFYSGIADKGMAVLINIG